MQQKSGFKNLLLEKKLSALADTLEKKEAQLNEVLSASNLDPTALTVVTRKLEVCTFTFSIIVGVLKCKLPRQNLLITCQAQIGKGNKITLFDFCLIWLRDAVLIYRS